MAGQGLPRAVKPRSSRNEAAASVRLRLVWVHDFDPGLRLETDPSRSAQARSLQPGGGEYDGQGGRGRQGSGRRATDDRSVSKGRKGRPKTVGGPLRSWD